LFNLGRTEEAKTALGRARALNPALVEEADFAQLWAEVGGV
jgi:hypothetical protein